MSSYSHGSEILKVYELDKMADDLTTNFLSMALWVIFQQEGNIMVDAQSTLWTIIWQCYWNKYINFLFTFSAFLKIQIRPSEIAPMKANNIS